MIGALLSVTLILTSTGCLETTECDENKPCPSGELCFRSRQTNGGFCVGECTIPSDCEENEVCGDCDNHCLGTTGSVCRPCQCNPRCPVGEACLDGICSTTVEECTCNNKTDC